MKIVTSISSLRNIKMTWLLYMYFNYKTKYTEFINYYICGSYGKNEGKKVYLLIRTSRKEKSGEFSFMNGIKLSIKSYFCVSVVGYYVWRP